MFEKPKFYVALSCFVALAATDANSAPCPRGQSVYVFDWGTEDGAQTVYTEDDAGPNNPRGVRFETWRHGKPVWSAEGEVFCSDIDAFCGLNISRRDDENLGIGQNRVPADVRDGCKKLTVPVTEITEGDKRAYIVFGGLAQFSLACSAVIGLRILSEKDLNDFERKENIFFLPSYVRFFRCNG